jgi:16S rRNA (guanine527-N7)-methyltransferase
LTLAEGMAALRAAGIDLPHEAEARLERYLDLLEKWNRVYNLTAVRERERMVTHHLLDSLAVLPWVGTGRLLDVGSGAGVPGIPLAIVRPDLEITLVDSNHKKGTFMQQAIAALELANAQVRVSRVEDLPVPPAYDVIVSRAFSDLATFAEACLRLLAPGGRLLAMKGLVPHEELAQLPPTVRVSGQHPVRVPGLSAERHLITLEAA